VGAWQLAEVETMPNMTQGKGLPIQCIKHCYARFSRGIQDTHHCLVNYILGLVNCEENQARGGIENLRWDLLQLNGRHEPPYSILTLSS